MGGGGGGGGGGGLSIAAPFVYKFVNQGDAGEHHTRARFPEDEAALQTARCAMVWAWWATSDYVDEARRTGKKPQSPTRDPSRPYLLTNSKLIGTLGELPFSFSSCGPCFLI